MKLAIVGSRGFKSLGLVADFIKKLKPTTKVVSGGAKGVDQFAVAQAQARGLAAEDLPGRLEAARQGSRSLPKRNHDLLSRWGSRLLGRHFQRHAERNPPGH